METVLPKKVFVAMSGGVDSSVAALLLQKEGYDVHGVFMQGWSNPNFDCQWQEDRQDAARVAAHLDIPFRALDFSKDYFKKVVVYLLREYRSGRTPNPDVMCNKEIKFGIFFDWAMRNGADCVATGHYVKIQNSKSNIIYNLLQAEDKNKDQSYFLWPLTQERLAKTLFPLGNYTKPEVRKLAREFGLPTAEKKDSQGICFVGKGSIADFLKDHIESRPGIVKTAAGKVVGEHEGVEYFTIGQRHGIGIRVAGGPYYVAKKQPESKTLVVAEGDTDPSLYRKELAYEDANWLINVEFPFRCKARIRYRSPLRHCKVEENRVLFDEPQWAVTPGQSIVFYKEEAVLGGAIIK